MLRVVSSAFGTGADWEREFIDDAAKYWLPQFENLRLYLTTFPGQQATVVESGAELSSQPAEVVTAMCDRFGVADIGDAVDVHGIAGRVEKLSDLGVLVRYTDPECGFLNLMSYPNGRAHRLRPRPRLPVRLPRRRAGRHPGGGVEGMVRRVARRRLLRYRHAVGEQERRDLRRRRADRRRRRSGLRP